MSVAIVTTRALGKDNLYRGSAMKCHTCGKGSITHGSVTSEVGQPVTVEGLALLCSKCANVSRGETVTSTDETTVQHAAERLGTHAAALRDAARYDNRHAYVTWAQGQSESVRQACIAAHPAGKGRVQAMCDYVADAVERAQA